MIHSEYIPMEYGIEYMRFDLKCPCQRFGKKSGRDESGRACFWHTMQFGLAWAFEMKLNHFGIKQNKEFRRKSWIMLCEMPQKIDIVHNIFQAINSTNAMKKIIFQRLHWIQYLLFLFYLYFFFLFSICLLHLDSVLLLLYR